MSQWVVGYDNVGMTLQVRSQFSRGNKQGERQIFEIGVASFRLLQDLTDVTHRALNFFHLPN